jgi:hypothetical protein
MARITRALKQDPIRTQTLPKAAARAEFCLSDKDLRVTAALLWVAGGRDGRWVPVLRGSCALLKAGPLSICWHAEWRLYDGTQALA